MPFPPKLKDKIQEITDDHETRLSALIPVLREVQNEFGWLSTESMEEVAEALDIPPSSVQNVASFYTMFFTEPVGTHVHVALQNSFLRASRSRKPGASPLQASRGKNR